MLNQIKQLIEQYDTILVYRHIMADLDALGSQFGIKTWIESKYPDKKVYALGNDSLHSFIEESYKGEVDYKNALAIICDTANRQRIDGEGWDQCDKIIKIDHHILVDDYGDLSIVNEKACAASEVVAQMLMDEKEVLSLETATYLYYGLIADSQRFSIPSTTPKTLEVASYLLSFGVDLLTCNLNAYSNSKQEYDYQTYLRTKVQYDDAGLAYVIANIEDYEKFGLSFLKAKECVFIMSNVDEFEIYVLYTEQSPGKYSGSFRSKHTIINDIAAMFGGGGHQFASGVKGMTLETIMQANQELIKRLKQG